MSVTAQLDHVVDLASPKLKQERADMEQSLRQTGDSLKALKQGLSTAVPSLQLLASSHDELKAAMPQASLLEVDLMEQDESKHARIRDLLAKVKLMRQLRADKLAELRRAAGAVDIRSKLLTGGDKSGLITAAMAPLEALVGQLESNFESQAKLLPVMVEVYGSQGQARKQVANVVQQQERFIEQLLSAFASYQSLTKKTSSMAAFIAAFASRLQALEQQADQLSAAQAVAPVQRRPKKSPPKAPNHRHTIAGLPAGDLLSGPLTGQATSLSPTRRSVLMDPELNG
jgi:chromosome segregation ATPase